MPVATLIDGPEFTANEIYEIQAEDAVEGAALGAAFGGIGVSNQPHQQLANRTSFLKQRQDSNIANIATLQGFVAKFISNLQSGAGYIKIPCADVARGAVTAIIQWAWIALADFRLSDDQTVAFAWSIPFPNAILLPPLVTGIHGETHGANIAYSIRTWGINGGSVTLDVPGSLIGGPVAAQAPEGSNGFVVLGIGF